VELEDTAAWRNARKAAQFEAQGLVDKHGITVSELRDLARAIQRERPRKAESIREVKALMKQHGLTVADLMEKKATRAYQHPVSGQRWNGAGAQPEWLKQALLSEGYRPEELRVG
jgi:DNA-binding protein H-NS